MLGRQLSIEHLHVRLGRITTASADNVRIRDPPDFPEPGDFARIARLSVHADVMAYLRSREIVLPEVVLRTGPNCRRCRPPIGRTTTPCHSEPVGVQKLAICASPTARRMS